MPRAFPPDVDACSIYFRPDPSGVEGDHSNPQTWMPATIGIEVVLIVLSTAFVGLRVADTWRREHKFLIDDCQASRILVLFRN